MHISEWMLSRPNCIELPPSSCTFIYTHSWEANTLSFQVIIQNTILTEDTIMHDILSFLGKLMPHPWLLNQRYEAWKWQYWVIGTLNHMTGLAWNLPRSYGELWTLESSATKMIRFVWNCSTRNRKCYIESSADGFLNCLSVREFRVNHIYKVFFTY